MDASSPVFEELGKGKVMSRENAKIFDVCCVVLKCAPCQLYESGRCLVFSCSVTVTVSTSLHVTTSLLLPGEIHN